MIKEKGETRNIQEALVTIMASVQENLAKQIGQIGETVSNKQQMTDYMKLRDKPYDDPQWMKLIMEQGEGDIIKGLRMVQNYTKEMEARIKRSERATPLRKGE